MPIYPFRCRDCEHKEEKLMSLYSHDDENRYKNVINCPKCGGFMFRVFTPFAIIGGEWDWRKGYRSDINDSAREVRYDLMRLEQNATEEGNLKKSRDKKQALECFAEANSDILKKADLK